LEDKENPSQVIEEPAPEQLPGKTQKRAFLDTAKSHDQKQKEIKELVEKFFKVSPEHIEKRLEIVQKFLDIIRGVRDIKGRLAPLMEPKGVGILTSARLSSSQCQGLSVIYTLDGLYPDFFSPLTIFGEKTSLTSISGGDGEGRREAISLMGAYSGAGILRELGLSLAPTPYKTDMQRKKAEKKGIFR